MIRDGHLFFARWGNGRGQSRKLPRTGWTWLSTVCDGYWRDTGAVPVDIPITRGLDGQGVWYKVDLGVRGLLVPDERGNAVAHMLCEPATLYYRNLTVSDHMPVLIRQRI